MGFKWYVVHVYSGSEKKVKEAIEEQVIEPYGKGVKYTLVYNS